MLFTAAPVFSQPRSGQAITHGACTTTWDLELAIRDRSAANRDTLVIGQASDATDNIDVACSESELPPPPPSPLYGVSMQLPDGATYSKRDIRADASESEWIISLAGVAPFYIYWDPTNLPSGVFHMTDNIDGGLLNLDMKTKSVIVIRNRTIKEVKINRYPASQCEPLTVARGWNMVSLPVDPIDKRVAAVFGNRRQRAFKYDEGYTAARFLEAGVGYWMSFRRGGTYNICGQPAGTNVTLAEGWNLVGLHRDDMDVDDISTSPANLLTSDFYGFTTAYETADSLHAGEGYWVESSAAGTMIVTDAGKRSPLSDPSFEEAPVDSSWATIQIQSSSGQRQQLYLSPNTLTADDLFDFEMPPESPGRIFQARFHTNKQVAYMFGSPAAFTVKGADGALTLSTSNLPHHVLQIESTDPHNPIQFFVDENNAATVPAGHETFIVTLAPRSVSNETTEAVGEVLQLYGNYPNPFTGQTAVRFDLTHATHVRIQVFNALGQKMSTTIDAALPSGAHQIAIDASAWPAGIYFYRIETDSRHIVRSMMHIH